MKDLVEDVRALAEHLGYKKFILVGHDWGGGVAWSFAIAHPEYLEKLVIINCPHPAITGARTRRKSGAAEGQPIHAAVPQSAGRADAVSQQLCGTRGWGSWAMA